MGQEKNKFPFWNVIGRVLVGAAIMGFVWYVLPKKHEKVKLKTSVEQVELSNDGVSSFADPKQMTQSERMLVGRWYYTVDEDDVEGYEADDWVQGFHYRSESLDEFRIDGTEVEKSVETFIYDVETDDWAGSVVLQYNTIYEGIWRLEGDSLTLKGKMYDVEYIKPTKFNKNEIPYKRELINYLEADHFPAARKELLKKRMLKVVCLTDDELVLEEDGEQWSCVRIIQ